MSTTYFKAASVAIAGAAILAACHGTGNYAPTSQLVPSQAVQAPADEVAQMEFVPSEAGGRAGEMPANIPACKAKPVAIPGTYIAYVSTGQVKMGTFTGSKTGSSWESLKYTKATAPPSPSPSPSSSPTTGPTPAPEYIYYGTYGIKNRNGGCAYLFTTQSGKPFKGLKFNGETFGQPQVAAKYFHASFVSSGPMTITVSKLSQSGGSGKFSLIDSKGKVFGTGTVTLIGRTLIQ